MIRLVPITAALADAASSARSFRAATGAPLEPMAEHVRQLLAQSLTHQARTGASGTWGGYLAVDDAIPAVIGTCAFVAPPGDSGEVEIAYHTFPPYERRGYGAAMAGALVRLAEESGEVHRVYAHTLPEENASARILARSGFVRAGTAHDDEAGLVWCWERELTAPT